MFDEDILSVMLDSYTAGYLAALKDAIDLDSRRWLETKIDEIVNLVENVEGSQTDDD